MTEDSNSAGQWQELLRLFEKAEQELKSTEYDVDELEIPSVNELRYAGYHLTRARARELESGGHLDLAAGDELDKARRHCQRAIFDAIEIRIVSYLESLREIHKAYASAGVADIASQYIDGYIDDLTAADRARAFLAEARNDHPNREQYYDRCRPYIESLDEIYAKWRNAAPAISAAVRRERRQEFWKVAGLVVAAASAMGIVAGAIVTWAGR